MQRRLAAILAADLVGYSRLMQADEAGTLARLHALRRERIEPLVAGHRGRIFKLMGDGILAEFPSVVDAVACAVAWQEALAGDAMQFRIAVNLGDVIAEDGDIYGDGVNIASRLEPLAEPGGICVSGTVHGEVRRKLDLDFEDMGEHRVKNIDGPIRAYRVVLGGAGRPGPDPAPAGAPAGGKPAIAVLPMANMSGDPEQAFFADGITEDIVTALSRTRWFSVTAPSAGSAFEGRSPDIREVARRLGVDYVLEGSVRKAGNRVRITVQLIDAATGSHAWADRFDRSLDDGFAVQDEIAQRISSILTERVWQDVARNITGKGPAEYGAWDHTLKGIELLHHLEPGMVDRAVGHLHQALALDPGNHVAHIALGFCFLSRGFWGDPDGDRIEKAEHHALRAKEIAPDDAQTYRLLSRVYAGKGLFPEAWDSVERALRINPNDGDVIGNRAIYHLFDGDFAQAVEWFDKVLELHADTPHTMDIMRYWKALALFGAREYGSAVALLGGISGLAFLKSELLGPCYVQMGETARARAVTAALLAKYPWLSLRQIGLWRNFRKQADRQHLLEAMRDAGLPD
jgi:adenylate cyclase